MGSNILTIQKLNYETVSDIISVNIINAVPPGVPNISTLKDYENMATQKI